MYHLNIINKTKIWYSISGLLILLSIVSLIIFGLNLGIDFTGGSMMDISFNQANRPSIKEIRESLSDFKLANLKIQPTGEKAYIIRMQNIDEETHQAILKNLNKDFKVQDNQDNTDINNSSTTDKQLDNPSDKNLEKSKPQVVQVKSDANPHNDVQVKAVAVNNNSIDEKNKDKESAITENRFDSIGPVIGEELKTKSIWAMIIVLIAIVLYIAYVFRKVSKPVESWKYGISAIAALAHDIIIIMGVFSVLGYFLGVEIDSFFISAILTILGFSVNDTIVTFDRIRENLHKKQDLTFKELINLSINETLTRSLNTSLTTFMVLLSVFVFGGETIKFFILALMLGIIIGTYSSIFIASPLLLFWYRRKYN